MLVIVTYDVSIVEAEGRQRLRRIAKECMACGQRVQNSVFECLVTPAKLVELKHKIKQIMDKEKDSVRFYNLGDNYHKRIEEYGKKSMDLEGTIIL